MANQKIDKEAAQLFLEEAQDLLFEWERICFSLEQDVEKQNLEALFRIAHNLKGASMAVGFADFSSFVHEIENLFGLVKRQKVTVNNPLIGFLFNCQSFLLAWVSNLKRDFSFQADTKAILWDAVCFYERPVVKSPEGEEHGHHPAALETHKEKELAAGNTPTVPPAAPLGNIIPDETIRISTRKIDQLIQLIGELTIHQSIIWHAKQTNSMDSAICLNAINIGDKMGREIQSHALSLRMLPLESLFRRLERIIHDNAQALNKRVRVFLGGNTVDLDKTIIEKVSDPLIHLVRNAIDHGVEADEGDRVRLGKERIALIRIEAKQDAYGIVINVSDDGRGLSMKKIREKALAKGLIGEHDELTKEDLKNFIFLSEFSTAEKVTDISGRGVGLDVVKKAVEDVRGNIQVSSEEGKGTTFAISLPTSLSIIEALVVVVQGYRYIIPMLELSEIIDLESYALEKTSRGDYMLNLRGRVMPVESLSGHFPMGPNGEGTEKIIVTKLKSVRRRPAIIVELETGKMAFEVERIIGQQQVVVRRLNKQLGNLPHLNSGTILADGEAGMIISLKRLAKFVQVKNTLKGE